MADEKKPASWTEQQVARINAERDATYRAAAAPDRAADARAGQRRDRRTDRTRNDDPAPGGPYAPAASVSPSPSPGFSAVGVSAGFAGSVVGPGRAICAASLNIMLMSGNSTFGRSFGVDMAIPSEAGD